MGECAVSTHSKQTLCSQISAFAFPKAAWIFSNINSYKKSGSKGPPRPQSNFIVFVFIESIQIFECLKSLIWFQMNKMFMWACFLNLFVNFLPDFMYSSICIFIWPFEDIQMAICVLIPTYCRAADKGRKENSEKLERRQKSKCYTEREQEGGRGEKRPICTKRVGWGCVGG